MSNYTLIIEKEHVKISKKKNKFKLEMNFSTSTDCDIIEKFSNDEIYKILRALNKDIIDYVNINKKDESDISIVLNNFENNEDYEGEDEKYYISFTRKLQIINDKSIIIDGNKNTVEFVKEKFKKLELEKINFNIQMVDNNINIIVKIKYGNDTLPVFMENYVAKLFGKIFIRLIKYYKKDN
jgi:aspartokinase